MSSVIVIFLRMFIRATSFKRLEESNVIKKIFQSIHKGKVEFVLNLVFVVEIIIMITAK